MVPIHVRNCSPSTNHSPVLLHCFSNAALWLEDESGGLSHFSICERSLSPEEGERDLLVEVALSVVELTLHSHQIEFRMIDSRKSGSHGHLHLPNRQTL